MMTPDNTYPERRRVTVARAGLVALWALFIVWGSLTSSPPKAPEVLAWDKAQHAAVYGLGALLTGRLLLLLIRSESRSWFLAFALIVLFGGGMELAQGLFSEVRQAQLADVVANAVGAAAGCAVAAGPRFVKEVRAWWDRR